MPGAPNNDASAHELRRKLDLAVLAAMGASDGDAQYHAGRMYESYARWRSSVEAVEARMRVHRRGMARGTGSNRLRPLEILAERMWEELADSVRAFPREGLLSGDELELVDIDPRFRLPDQEPLIDPGRIEMSDGTEGDLGTWDRVMYATMLLSIGFKPPLPVPLDSARAARIVSDYEREAAYLDRLAREKGNELVDGYELNALVRFIRREWHAVCQEAGPTLSDDT